MEYSTNSSLFQEDEMNGRCYRVDVLAFIFHNYIVAAATVEKYSIS